LHVETAVEPDGQVCRGSGPGEGSLLRLLAHEIRTPLHAVHGFAELLLAGSACPLSGEALEHVREIARAGRALEQVASLLQELAALDVAERVDTPAVTVDLGTTLRALGFALALEPAIPAVPGAPAAWRRVAVLCRSYLAPADLPEAALRAAATRRLGGGLELELRRDDMRRADGTGLLAIELARRVAARQGGELCLKEPWIVTIRWAQARLAVAEREA
jgi:hypothetical protein